MQKKVKQILNLLIRIDSKLVEPYFRFVSQVSSCLSGYYIGNIKYLSNSSENCIKELFPSMEVETSYPKKINICKCHKKNNQLCPAIRAYMFFDQIVNINSSSIYEKKKNILRSDIIFNSKRHKYTAGYLKEHGRKKGLLKCEKPIKKIEHGFYMGGNGSFNYYHFLIEIIPKLELITKLDQYKDFPLLVNEKVLEIESFLQIINRYSGNRKLSILKENECYHVKKLLCISSGSYISFNIKKGCKIHPTDCITRRENISFLRSLSLEASKNIHISTPQYVFLGRKQKRRSYNQDEVINKLSTLGFVVIYPEQYSFLEQVKIFNNAKFIVGPTGAAWTNLAFAAERTKALCWMPEAISGFSAFSTIADIVGVDLQYITYKTKEKNTDILYSAPYNVDKDKIYEYVKQNMCK